MNIQGCHTLHPVITKSPDDFPAVYINSTLVIIVGELVVFNSRVIKAQLNSVLGLEAVDFSAFICSSLRIVSCDQELVQTV